MLLLYLLTDINKILMSHLFSYLVFFGYFCMTLNVLFLKFNFANVFDSLLNAFMNI